jgi:hypothetical protein
MQAQMRNLETGNVEGRAKAIKISTSTTKYTAVKMTKPSAKNGTLAANSMELNWTYPKPPAGGNPTTYYAIYQVTGTGKNAVFTLVDTVDVSKTSYKIESLTANTKYTFVVRAVVWDGIRIFARTTFTIVVFFLA